jgi:hypothetical protein
VKKKASGLVGVPSSTISALALQMVVPSSMGRGGSNGDGPRGAFLRPSRLGGLLTDDDLLQ